MVAAAIGWVGGWVGGNLSVCLSVLVDLSTTTQYQHRHKLILRVCFQVQPQVAALLRAQADLKINRDDPL